MRDNLGTSDEPESIFSELPTPTESEKQFNGTDQQKAQAAWDKLQQSTNDDGYPTLRCQNSGLIFYCIPFCDTDDIKNTNYIIKVYPPDHTSGLKGCLVEMDLIRKKDGSFTVMQKLAAILESKTDLTVDMANSLLNQIARSVEENSEIFETEDLIQKTRDKIR